MAVIITKNVPLQTYTLFKTYSSFVCLYVYAYDFKSKVHCRSALGPGASGLQSWMTIKKTEISAQHEFLKPIYLCVYRVTILKYLGVQEKC